MAISGSLALECFSAGARSNGTAFPIGLKLLPSRRAETSAIAPVEPEYGLSHGLPGLPGLGLEPSGMVALV